MGVFPFPPQVRLPTLTTGTGSLRETPRRGTSEIKDLRMRKRKRRRGKKRAVILPVLAEEAPAIEVAAEEERQSVEGGSQGEEREEGAVEERELGAGLGGIRSGG